MEPLVGHRCRQVAFVRRVYFLLYVIHVADVTGFNINTGLPKVYTGPSDSGFGFSVTQFAINDSKWLIIGAPFDKETSTPDGAVYRCSEYCARMTFNTYGSSRTNSSYSMIGATVTALQRDGLIIACAPRYTYYEEPFFAGEDDAIYMMGACFVYDAKDDTYRKKPYTPCMPGTVGIRPLNKPCAAGFSLSAIDGEETFVVGAVGTDYYRGQYIWIEIARRRYPDYGIIGSKEGDYSGYGVATGRFSGDTIDVVSGAPRGTDHLGEVSLYHREASKGWHKLITLYGRQFGEYFGSVLAVGDLNGDGADDLVVGAPFHANEIQRVADVGKVYIFYQNPGTRRQSIFSEHVTELQGDITSSGRFGFAVCVLSDIDQDNFKDLAVGAPLEGVSGNVYIFLGSPQGVSTVPTQVIRGTGFRGLHLSMFGAALSGILDMDNNGYPDLLIGAPTSGHSLLLMTHPVVTVDLQVTTDVKYIKLDNLTCDVIMPHTAISCFQMNTVLSYDGKQVPEKMSLRLRWILNPHNTTANMLLFRDDRGQRKTNFTEVIANISKGIQLSLQETIFSTSHVIEYIPPIQIQVEYQLESEPVRLLDPVLDKKMPSSTVTQVQVYRPPGDLDLQVESLRPEAVLGRGEQVEFRLTTTNMAGVPCYNTEISVSLPAGITYSSVEGDKSVTCIVPADGQRTVICSFGFRFPDKPQVDFVLHTSVYNDSLLFHNTYVSYFFNLSSVNDVNTTNNVDTVELNLVSKAELEITGTSSPDQLQVTENSDSQNVTHLYKVTNHGPSQLVGMEIWISWPVVTSDGIPLLVLNGMPVVSQDKGSCHVEEHNLSPLQLSHLEQCVADDPTVRCQRLHCAIKAVAGGQSVDVEVKSTVLPEVIKLSQLDNSLILNSNVKVVGESIPGIPAIGRTTDHVTISTRIQFPGVIREEKASWWIYVLASCCGLVLLIVLIYVMWKFGFFKRETRERLYSAKRESINLNWPPAESDTDDGAIYPLTEREGDAAIEDEEEDKNTAEVNNTRDDNTKTINELDDCIDTLRQI